MKQVKFLAMLCVCFLAVQTAQATFTFYTDRNDWETNVAGIILTEDFESVTPYFLSEGINNTGLITINLINLLAENEWNSINSGTGNQSVNGTNFY